VLLRRLESGGFALDTDPAAAPLAAAEVAMRLRARPAGVTNLHLLLPAARCLVTTVPVAKHEVRHIGRTLPWALEDRVLEPVEQLHIAHGPVVDGSAAVAAINAAWLREVLDELRAAGLEPDSACSELFLLPWRAGQWTVLLSDESAAPVLVRHGAHAGFACARSNLHTALQLLLNEAGEAPRQLVVSSPGSATDADIVARIPVLLHARILVQRQALAQLLGNMALPACNLLQGAFAPPLPWSQWWRQWRFAAALLAGLLVSDLALSGYESLRLNREAESNEAQVLALFRTVQPDGEVVDPRMQLEQALAAAAVSGRDGFLGLLGRMAPAFTATAGARVQNLDYDGSGTLQVQLLTDDYATAESLRVKLQQLGLEAELLGSNRVGAGNLTRLRVGGGA
jgi:general secretion pathway protein L